MNAPLVAAILDAIETAMRDAQECPRTSDGCHPVHPMTFQAGKEIGDEETTVAVGNPEAFAQLIASAITGTEVVHVRYVMNGTTCNDEFTGKVHEAQVFGDGRAVVHMDGPVLYALYAPDIRILRGRAL